MNAQLTEEQTMIKEMAGRIATDHLLPNAEALDQGEGRDQLMANFQVLADNGFMGLNLDANYGGSEAGSVAYALAMEEFGKACASTTVAVSITNMVGEVIQSCGSEEQKQKYIPKLCDGTFRAGSFCLTEPNAGSDPAGMKTSAVMDGNEWVLNGSKQYISSAEFADIFVVWAVTDPDAPKGRGISTFLVEKDAPGMTIGKAEKKLGQHGSPSNPVIFEDCRIPADAIMGPENTGFRVAMHELTGGRIGVAAMALGIARAAMDAGIEYVLQREQHGSRIADFQGIQWMVADTETELEAARLLILSAAQLKEAGLPFAKQASMAKVFATEAAQKATYNALQLHGGAGYIKDYPLERYARDVRICTIYEGTSEIQRHIISKHIFKDAA